MKKILVILREEYRRHVFKKSYLGVLLFPVIVVLIAMIVGGIAASAERQGDAGVLGIVDPAAALGPETPAAIGEVSFRRFTSADAAKTELEHGKIIGYAVLAADFPKSGALDLYYWRTAPGENTREALETAVQAHLLSGVQPDVRKRLLDGNAFTYRTFDGTRALGGDAVLTLVLPLIVGVLFVIALLFGSQYLMQAVVDEKENRTMEVLVSSVTPFELLAGKILGLTMVSLTQVVVWSATAALAMIALVRVIPDLGGLEINAGFLLAMLLLFLLQFVFFAAIMAAIGSIVNDSKQAQQWAAPFVLVAIAPEFFIPAIFAAPNSAVAVILTVLPFTSPFAFALRHGLTEVPFWQIALAVVLLALSAWLGIRFAARIFKSGMLRYGTTMPWSELFDSLRA
jgi:ABC-2 type transport system permease protein